MFLPPARTTSLGSCWRKCIVCLLFTVALRILSLSVMRSVIGSPSYDAYMAKEIEVEDLSQGISDKVGLGT